MLRRILCLKILLATLLLPIAHAQEAPSLEALQQRYSRLDALQASFTQVIGSEFGSDSTQISGTVLLSGDRYRVTSPAQTVVTDGQTTWIYSPADSQVVLNDADAETATLTPETFLSEATEEYTVNRTRQTNRRGTPHHVLDLQATTDTSRFRDATLWVRQSDHIVTRLRATDRNGSTLDLRLHDIVVNPALNAEAFTFSPPPEAEVVDLRSQAEQ